MILVLVFLAMFLVPADGNAMSGWKQTVSADQRIVLTATPARARLTARACEKKGLKACLTPLRAAYLLADCREQGINGRRFATSLRAAAKTGRVLIVTETGGYPWRCEGVTQLAAS